MYNNNEQNEQRFIWKGRPKFNTFAFYRINPVKGAPTLLPDTGSSCTTAQQMKNEWMEIKSLLREFIELFREFLAYLKDRKDGMLPDLPEHMDTTQVYSYLGIDKATFYRSVFLKKLTPCTYAGSRPYYKRADVLALMDEYGPHEKGSQTYGKKPLKKAPSKKNPR